MSTIVTYSEGAFRPIPIVHLKFCLWEGTLINRESPTLLSACRSKTLLYEKAEAALRNYSEELSCTYSVQPLVILFELPPSTSPIFLISRDLNDERDFEQCLLTVNAYVLKKGLDRTVVEVFVLIDRYLPLYIQPGNRMSYARYLIETTMVCYCPEEWGKGSFEQLKRFDTAEAFRKYAVPLTPLCDDGSYNITFRIPQFEYRFSWNTLSAFTNFWAFISRTVAAEPSIHYKPLLLEWMFGDFSDGFLRPQSQAADVKFRSRKKEHGYSLRTTNIVQDIQREEPALCLQLTTFAGDTILLPEGSPRASVELQMLVALLGTEIYHYKLEWLFSLPRCQVCRDQRILCIDCQDCSKVGEVPGGVDVSNDRSRTLASLKGISTSTPLKSLWNDMFLLRGPYETLETRSLGREVLMRRLEGVGGPVSGPGGCVALGDGRF